MAAREHADAIASKAMRYSRYALIALLSLPAAGLAGVACNDADTEPQEEVGGAATSQGGSEAAAGLGAGGAASGVAGAQTPIGGAGSTPSCEGLSEVQCGELDCVRITGVRWPGTLDHPREYAGCATDCFEDGCGFPDVEACAVDPSGQCWGLGAPHTPDGWELLGEYGNCSDFSQCATSR